MTNSRLHQVPGRIEEEPSHFRLLAAALAGRSVAVAHVLPGEDAHTDGRTIFIAGDLGRGGQRSQVIVQSALLGGGSLAPAILRRLRGRPRTTDRYLALEGRRLLATLPGRLGRSIDLSNPGPPITRTAAHSLEVALGRTPVPAPPAWFGRIRPGCVLSSASEDDVEAPLQRLLPKTENSVEDERHTEDAKVPDGRLGSMGGALLAKMLGRVPGLGRARAAGPEVLATTIRRMGSLGRQARPSPMALPSDHTELPASTRLLGGALHPEWDTHRGEYRQSWCRVLEVGIDTSRDLRDAGLESDHVLRRRLARLGLSPKTRRARPSGDDIDLDAVVEFATDVRAGWSPAEHIYLERQKLARNLGVLILLDASGSATDLDPMGRSVHQHQRRATATLTATLEELGDRVAVYGFRSYGRTAVHLIPIKRFSERFGAAGRSGINRLQPAGFTRLGAAIRHSGEILKTGAGTPYRLLIVLSDGFPYDEGYEARYAENDTARALAELRDDGMASLCLSIGAATSADALDRVFGPARHAHAPALADLSPRMDELFLAALRELAAPSPSRRRRHG